MGKGFYGSIVRVALSTHALKSGFQRIISLIVDVDSGKTIGIVTDAVYHFVWL